MKWTIAIGVGFGIILIVYSLMLNMVDSLTDLPNVESVSTLTLDQQKELINVEGGTFMMGSNDGENDERPVHQVTVGSFMIGKIEVTQELWDSIMGSNLSYSKESRKPVETVTWYDAVEFCNKLSEKEGLQKAYSGNGDNIICDFNSNGYRLPTEAEWEYAARGGKKSKGYKYSGGNDIGAISWYDGNSGSSTHDVRTKQPNELGLYDMSGNVWEWCWDWYGNYSLGSQINPKGANSGCCRVLRGGSWSFYGGNGSVAVRLSNEPSFKIYDRGFRVARTKN